MTLDLNLHEVNGLTMPMKQNMIELIYVQTFGLHKRYESQVQVI